MSSTTAEVLGAVATVYGVGAAVTVLLQARQMLKRHASCTSRRASSPYVGGYAIWLLYGVSIGSVPITVVHMTGLACGGFTLAVALAMRGSLLRPRSWNSCQIELPASKEEANR